MSAGLGDGCCFGWSLCCISGAQHGERQRAGASLKWRCSSCSCKEKLGVRTLPSCPVLDGMMFGFDQICNGDSEVTSESPGADREIALSSKSGDEHRAEIMCSSRHVHVLAKFELLSNDVRPAGNREISPRYRSCGYRICRSRCRQ